MFFSGMSFCVLVLFLRQHFSDTQINSDQYLFLRYTFIALCFVVAFLFLLLPGFNIGIIHD